MPRLIARTAGDENTRISCEEDRRLTKKKKKKICRRHCGVNHDDSIAITCHVRSCSREAKSKEKNAIARSSWSKRGRRGRLNVVQLPENIFSVSRSSFLRISSYYYYFLLLLLTIICFLLVSIGWNALSASKDRDRRSFHTFQQL